MTAHPAHRDVIAALVADGSLTQVGWRCDQETAADLRTQLCAHPWPCGPTYAVSVRPEHTDDKGDPAVGRALLEQGTLPRPPARLTVNIASPGADRDVAEHLFRTAAEQLARSLDERAAHGRDAVLWHHLLHDLPNEALSGLAAVCRRHGVHPHVADALNQQARRRRMDSLADPVLPEPTDTVMVAVDPATDDPATLVVRQADGTVAREWPEGDRTVLLNGAGDPAAVRVPAGTVAPGSTGAWWQGFASHYLRAEDTDHDPETCTWCVRTAQDLGAPLGELYAFEDPDTVVVTDSTGTTRTYVRDGGAYRLQDKDVPVTSLSAPEPPTDPPDDEQATADGPHEQLTVDQVDGSGHTPADCPGHDCPWHEPF